MPEWAVITLIVFGFLIAFPLLWLGVTWLIGRLGGWASLAAQYPAHKPATGDRYGWRSGRLSLFGSYSNCLNVTVSPSGVHVVPLFFFRFGHRPIWIPWDAVTRFERRGSGVMTAIRLHVRSDRGDDRKVHLWGRGLADHLEHNANLSVE